MLSFEPQYRREAEQTPPWGPFGLMKIWIGPFYIGLWGLVALFAAIAGGGLWLSQVLLVDPNRTSNPVLNFVRGQVYAPAVDVGTNITFDPAKGFYWQAIVLLATLTFFAWMMRQFDVSRLLKMGYQVPIAYAAVFTSWVTIQIVRPLLLGYWSEGFPLGVMAHLDWLSSFGYRFYNFFFNPFHAIGISALFGSAFALSLHGATILSASGLKSEGVTEDNVNRFYWDFFGYSIGEVGIHRLAFWAAVLCVLVSNLCLVLSGTVVQDWSAFWDFWNKAPFWSGFGVN
jgi:hypothetical protein